MKKLQALVDALHQEALFFYPEKLESWPESVQLVPRFQQLSADQVLLGDLRYTGVVDIEEFAGCLVQLSAFVAAFLQDHPADDCCGTYDLKPPDIDTVYVEETGVIDVQIALDLVEPVYVVADPDGCLTFDQRRWAFNEVPEFWVAQFAEVYGRDHQNDSVPDYAPPIVPDLRDLGETW